MKRSLKKMDKFVGALEESRTEQDEVDVLLPAVESEAAMVGELASLGIKDLRLMKERVKRYVERV